MKVYLGPFKNYIGPYQIADAIFFWTKRTGIYADEPEIYNRWDYKAAEKLGDWLYKSWIGKFCNWLESKRERKIKVRIDQYDTWNVDSTLAYVIHPLLVKLKEQHHGYSNIDPEDAPHIGMGEKDDYGLDSKAEERWNWVLDEMIWTFKHYNDDEYKELYYLIDGEIDTDNMKKLDDRVKNGLRLFGKYYQALWS